MASLTVTFSGVWNAADLGIGTGVRSVDPRLALQSIDGLILGLMNGSYSGTYDVVTSSTNAVKASSDITATTSGSLGVAINGTTVTTAFTTSQDGTATQAVADINANTTVNKWVTASKGATGHLTVTANIPGELGNCCTLTVTGTGAAATGSGKLAGGTGSNGQPTSFSLA